MINDRDLYSEYDAPVKSWAGSIIKPGWADLSMFCTAITIACEHNPLQPTSKSKTLEFTMAFLQTFDKDAKIDIIETFVEPLIVLRVDEGIVFFNEPLADERLEVVGKSGTHPLTLRFKKMFGTPEFLVRFNDFIRESGVETRKIKEVDKNGDPIFGIQIHKLFKNPDGSVNNITSQITTKEMEDIRKELYPYMDVDMFTKQYLKSDSMIAIFGGGPGTGKTCLTRHIVKRIAIEKGQDFNSVEALYVKDLSLLKEDSVWACISEIKPDVIILDDFDKGLEQRTDEKPNLVMEKLLSFSNGFQKENCKMLITTNRSLENTDKALTRTGRSFAVLQLPYLDYSVAMELWMNVYGHSKESFKEIFKDDMKVSQSDLDSEAKLYREFENKGYLYDTSIDIQPSLQPEDRRNLNDKGKFDPSDVERKKKSIGRGLSHDPYHLKTDYGNGGGFH